MQQADISGIFFEATHRRKDGSLLYVEVSSQGADIGGRRILLSVIRDITDRKKAEKELLKSHAKYHSLFMNMNSGYVYFKILNDRSNNPVDLEFIEVNEKFEHFVNMKKENILYKYYSEVFPNSKDIVILQLLQNKDKLNKGESFQVESYYSSIYQKWFSFIVYSPETNKIVTIVSDITKQKQSEIRLIEAKDAAEAANRAKNDFLSNMSHEIRTPINGIMGMLDLTLLTNLEKEQRDKLKIAKECANALTNIVDEILDLAKLESGKISLKEEAFDLLELLEGIIITHLPDAMKKDLKLHSEFDAELPRVLIGDGKKLQQILDNIVDNSIKFTDTGIITLSVNVTEIQQDSINLKFCINDTGIGIAQEDKERIFMSFSQVEGPYTKRYRGVGLGLAITKKLVEIMGGEIKVDSFVGSGSEFYFSLTFRIGDFKRKQQGAITMKEEYLSGSAISEDMLSKDAYDTQMDIENEIDNSFGKGNAFTKDDTCDFTYNELNLHRTELELDLKVIENAIDYHNTEIIECMLDEICEICRGIKEQEIVEAALQVKIKLQDNTVNLFEEIKQLKQLILGRKFLI
ncbi:PAS domain S-box protein [Mobilitalea sibirica]|uniref:Circadian input-output histidine kinase CikA n=1 Tax=Mobilitalea sibirica TaxID=1462919 RepID=A0A8J7HA25_9FIRM|nr:ATP-binding protein [Mobilitalea sibirica]MBH1939536.1 PAS domain S-box protein [Mobilitalea sibirica]